MKTDKTKVLFRVDGQGEVTAVMPYLKVGNGYVTCYAHIGQHGTCSREWVRDHTRNATLAEYTPLRRELCAAPYHYRFQVLSRLPNA